ncbi:hypothetical protein DNHGIG_27210 [Collibacillus ludicampi]|uniref:RCK C-terminal domain-containing protein n=1 Tax=Collibacillus ludicampi TaxID=2771369 RepID=A0AAV4LIB6_9BACL|nr:hypothetical protein DNHGIG_27210 [Collibacillus ludicampi]
MGIRVAHNLISANVLDFIELSPEYSILEIVATRKMIGRSLAELDIRKKFGCNVLAIRNGQKFNIFQKRKM